jgi:hypothetical protein
MTDRSGLTAIANRTKDPTPMPTITAARRPCDIERQADLLHGPMINQGGAIVVITKPGSGFRCAVEQPGCPFVQVDLTPDEAAAFMAITQRTTRENAAVALARKIARKERGNGACLSEADVIAALGGLIEAFREQPRWLRDALIATQEIGPVLAAVCAADDELRRIPGHMGIAIVRD